MSRASDRIWAQVCGYPKVLREQRFLAVWKAFFDDSGNSPDQSILVLAGFVGRYDKWATFADEWKAELEREPKLDYFKFAEANKLKGQFDCRKGWTETMRNERVERLIDVLERVGPARIGTGIQHDHFNKLILRVPVPQRVLMSDKPYAMAFGRIAGAVAAIATWLQLSDPVDCTFDLQDGYETEAHAFWGQMKAPRADGKELRELGHLSFHDEETEIPLQAADLLAGFLRFYSLNGHAPFEGTERLLAIPGVWDKWTGDEVREQAINMLRTAEAFSLLNPDVDLDEYDPERAARVRKNNRRNKRPTS